MIDLGHWAAEDYRIAETEDVMEDIDQELK